MSSLQSQANQPLTKTKKKTNKIRKNFKMNKKNCKMTKSSGKRKGWKGKRKMRWKGRKRGGKGRSWNDSEILKMRGKKRSGKRRGIEGRPKGVSVWRGTEWCVTWWTHFFFVFFFRQKCKGKIEMNNRIFFCTNEWKAKSIKICLFFLT